MALDFRAYLGYFEMASTASLAALIIDDGNTSHNGPSGSGRFLDTSLKYRYRYILLERYILQEINHMNAL